jgi:hypothetical protein
VQSFFDGLAPKSSSVQWLWPGDAAKPSESPYSDIQLARHTPSLTLAELTSGHF